jgi:O-antigen/teichoic acid export membrane protein
MTRTSVIPIESEGPEGGAPPGTPPPSPAPSLQTLAVRGSLWTLGGYGLAQAIRFGSNVVLTNLVLKADFALMGLVNALLQGLQMFSDVGISHSVVQHPKGDEQRFLDTAWTIQVVRGFGLTLIACLLAWPFAAVYASTTEDPKAWDLLMLVPIASITCLLGGFESTNVHAQSRKVALGKVTMMNLTSQVVAVAVMIALAAATGSVLALVIGSIAGAICTVAFSHLLLPGRRNRFCWDRECAGWILGFGKWILLSTTMTFLAMQADRLMLPALLTFDQAGVYNIAASLAVMGPAVLGSIHLSVSLPLFSRVHGRGEPLANAVRQIKLPSLAIGCYLVALMIGGSDAFITFVYPAGYADAAWIVPILAGGAWFMMLDGIYSAALIASGQARWVAVSCGAKVVGMLILIPLLSSQFGFVGAVVGCASTDLVKCAVSFVGARALGCFQPRMDVQMTILTLLVGLVMAEASHLLGVQLGLAPLARVAFVFVTVTLVLSPWLLRAARTVLRKPT